MLLDEISYIRKYSLCILGCINLVPTKLTDNSILKAMRTLLTNQKRLVEESHKCSSIQASVPSISGFVNPLPQ
jgi:hypothetical protein